MCSVSNAAVSFYVARELGATQFGAFSLAYVTYSFALTGSRGLATDPLLVRFSGTHLVSWRRAVAQCTGTALVTGLLTGACALVAAAVLSGAPRLAFLALGLVLPGLLLQDSWRYSFFALGRGSQAFINDTIWTLTLVPPLLFLRITHHNTVFWFTIAWGAAATVAACVGPLQARVIPRPPNVWAWVSQHRDLAFRYLAENASNSGAGQLRIYGVGAIAGLAAVGYVQAAGLLMGPFLVIFLGISLVTVPEATRVLRHSPQHLRLYCALVGAGHGGPGAGLGRRAADRAAERARRTAAWQAAVEASLPAGGAVHDLRHGCVRHSRRHGGPARPRRRAAKPACDGSLVGRLPRLRPGGSLLRWRHRNGSRRCPRDVGRRAAVVVATRSGDAGIRQDTAAKPVFVPPSSGWT